MMRCWQIVLCLGLVGCGADRDQERMIGQLASIRIEVAADIGERILHHDSEEGMQVAAGDPLLTQDATLATTRLQRATAALAMRQAELDELIAGTRSEQISAKRAAVRGAEEDQRFFTDELKRLASLAERNLVSDERRDAASSQLDRSEALLSTLNAELSELINGAREQTIRRAEAARDVAVADVAEAQISLRRHRVLAPAAAVLDRLLFEPGETPAVGQAVAILLADAQPQAELYVPTALRARVLPGTELNLFVDGIDEPIRGVVKRVSDEAAFTPYFALTEHDRGRLSYLAEVEVQWDRYRLPDGLAVEAALIRQAL